jgi:thiamine-monophosphate kinase
MDTDPERSTRLADVGEDALLARILPLLNRGTVPDVLIGPGDDTALLQLREGAVLVTTDALVRGSDWRDEWSTGADVGAKAVAQNVADIAAMGGTATALLVTLVADPHTRVAWVLELTTGLAEAALDAGVPVVGGDLSSAPTGVVVLSLTALGTMHGRTPVRRSGACAGDVVAVAGGLGRSGAGLLLLEEGRAAERADLVGYHRRPRPPYEQGPRAALAGATAMIDISDGLVRDGGRVARASGVTLALDWATLEHFAEALVPALTAEQARSCVLGGGEEHALLACFPADASLPSGWEVIGAVAGSGDAPIAPVTLDGRVAEVGGWDHFGG